MKGLKELQNIANITVSAEDAEQCEDEYGEGYNVGFFHEDSLRVIEKELKALEIIKEYIFIDKLNEIRSQPVIKLKGGNFNCLGKEEYDLLKEVLKNESRRK